MSSGTHANLSREVRRQHPLEAGRVTALEVTRERGRHLVLAAERLRHALEVDEAQLDEVGAEPPTPHHLGAQRLVDLVGGQHSLGDQHLP